MKKPTAKIAPAKSKVPSVKPSEQIKAAHSAKVTVQKKSPKVNGQKITKF